MAVVLRRIAVGPSLAEERNMIRRQRQATCRASFPSNQQVGIEVRFEIFSAEDEEPNVF
jgi:hypothetical protein